MAADATKEQRNPPAGGATDWEAITGASNRTYKALAPHPTISSGVSQE
ncbi:hypothetical protein [Phormidesmis sp. 146-33]